MKSEARPGFVLAAALGLGALAHLLIYGQEIGVGWTLFLLSLPAALIALAARFGVPLERGNVVFLSAPLAFFALQLSLRADLLVTGLNLTACVFLLALLCRYALTPRLLELPIGRLLGAPFVLLWAAVQKAALPAWEVFQAARSVGGERDLTPVARGLLLATPVLGVLAWLLISADAAFEQTLNRSVQWLLSDAWQERILRLLWVLAVAWAIGGGLLLALKRPDAPEETVEAPRGLGAVESLTVLACVAGLFGLFLAIQAAYLFGGAERVLNLPGLTYAQYARRGFAELTCVAAVVLVLVTGLRRATVFLDGRTRAFACLATIVLGETLVLLASAWQRMAAYEAAFGATRTRLEVDTFLVWLGLALCWLGATLWVRAWTSRFAVGGLVCALGFAASLNLLNLDAMVVRRNAEHWARTGRLDTDHLRALSDDAAPELAALEQRLPEGALRDRVREIRAARRPLSPGWQSWNAARVAAR